MSDRKKKLNSQGTYVYIRLAEYSELLTGINLKDTAEVHFSRIYNSVQTAVPERLQTCSL